MTIRRSLPAVLAAAALIAPAAQAQPPDMHASTALAAAKVRTAQDLRSPDARDAARTAEAVDAHGATAGQLPPAGQPTWPTHPTTLARPAQEPATHGDGSPVPVIPLVAGSVAVLIAAFTGRRATRRVNRRARVAA